MTTQFKCGHCGKEIIIKFLKIGEKAKCRNCGFETIIPEDALQTNDEPEYHKKSAISESNDTLHEQKKKQIQLTTLQKILLVVAFAIYSLSLSVQIIKFYPVNGALCHMITMIEFMFPFFMMFNVILIVPVWLVIAIISLFHKKLNKIVYYMAALWIFCLCGIFIGFCGDLFFRPFAMRKTATQMTPLISALNEYRIRHNHYPDDVSELVPSFIQELPGTEMCSYPDIDYEKRDFVEGYDKNLKKSQFDTGGYEISIYTGFLMNFDQFIYWPSENYPYYTHGGNVEFIASWAYIHE